MSPHSRWGVLTRRRAESGWADDAGDLNVFVPGLMGAGILISGVILISDGVRHLLPSRGVRRRINVVRGVRRIVVDLAEAAGIEIAERNLVRRERRSPWLYLAGALFSLPLATLAARWGFNAYSSTGSSLEGNGIAIVYGLVAAGALAAFGLVSLVLMIPGLDVAPVRWLITHAPFSRLSPPPDGVAERAQLLIPDLEKGASQ